MLVFVVGLWNYVNSRFCHGDDDDDDDADDDDDDEADDDSDTAILVQTWTVALALSRTHKRSQICSRWQTDLPRALDARDHRGGRSYATAASARRRLTIT